MFTKVLQSSSKRETWWYIFNKKHEQNDNNKNDYSIHVEEQLLIAIIKNESLLSPTVAIKL